MVQLGLIAVFLPGVINSAAPNIYVPKAYQHFYDTNWCVNTFAGFFIYSILCLVFPAKETLIPKPEVTILDGRLPEDEVEEEVTVEMTSKKG